MDKQILDCALFGRCGGCGWGGQPLQAQHSQKLDSVRSLHDDIRFAHSPQSRVRDRADLIWAEQSGRKVLGLYALDGSRQIIDLDDGCMMMSEPLEAFLREFRQWVPPIRLGSVRLRVAPSGERGVWLDFANQDVKALFEERSYLQRLSQMAFVEIGQRRKALIWREGAPKLVDPILKPWFETYSPDGSAIPLYGPVGGFSQTGFVANRALVQAVCEGAESSGVHDWVEMFCGNGNFTLALAARDNSVEAVEMDPLALAGLEMSLTDELRKKIHFSRSDVYLKTKSLPPVAGRGLLVDPPRAGLRELLNVMKSGEKPAAIIYVSCFTEVFVREVEELKNLGYLVKSIVGIDQFPHSPHAEWVSLLTLA